MADLEISFTNINKRKKLTANPVDQFGRPAGVDPRNPLSGTATGDASAPAVEGDPLSCWAYSGSAPGDVDYVITADADLGEGVVPLSATVHAVVGSNTASALGLFTVGEEEDAV